MVPHGLMNPVVLLVLSTDIVIATWWSQCSKSCGGGVKCKLPRCTRQKPCNVQPCPTVDGAWSNWSPWTDCLSSCGGGLKARHRECDSPPPQHGGKPCSGRPFEVLPCNAVPCPLDGAWSEWGSWGECSKRCGKGERVRRRQCNNPPPLYNGKPCRGQTTETMGCSDLLCAVDGGWSDWGAWSQCAKTCGGGLQWRTRSCTKPQPQDGGKTCPGEPYAMSPCNESPCQMAGGGWSEWNAWSRCSKTCGNGERMRTRMCDRPIQNGKACQGDNTEIEGCNDKPCPEDGWLEWSMWSRCSKTCGTGIQVRTRKCDPFSPTYRTITCQGDETDVAECNNQICQV